MGFPIAAEITGRHQFIEKLLHFAVGDLAGEVRDQVALLAQRLHDFLTFIGIAGVNHGDGVAALTPELFREVFGLGDSRELDKASDHVVFVLHELAPELDRPCARR